MRGRRRSRYKGGWALLGGGDTGQPALVRGQPAGTTERPRVPQLLHSHSHLGRSSVTLTPLCGSLRLRPGSSGHKPDRAGVQVSDTQPGLPGRLSGNESTRCGLHPWVGKSPWRRTWQRTPAFLPGESHGQRSLAGYRPRGRRESGTIVTKEQHTSPTATSLVATEVTMLEKNPLPDEQMAPRRRRVWTCTSACVLRVSCIVRRCSDTDALRGSMVAQVVKNLPAMQETQVRSLG